MEQQRSMPILSDDHDDIDDTTLSGDLVLTAMSMTGLDVLSGTTAASTSQTSPTDLSHRDRSRSPINQMPSRGGDIQHEGRTTDGDSSSESSTASPQGDEDMNVNVPDLPGNVPATNSPPTTESQQTDENNYDLQKDAAQKKPSSPQGSTKPAAQGRQGHTDKRNPSSTAPVSNEVHGLQQCPWCEMTTSTPHHVATCMRRKAACPVGASLRSGKCTRNGVTCDVNLPLEQMLKHVPTHNDANGYYNGVERFLHHGDEYFQFCAEFGFGKEFFKTGGKLFYTFHNPDCLAFNKIGLTIGFTFTGRQWTLWAVQNTGLMEESDQAGAPAYTMDVDIMRTLRREEILVADASLHDLSAWGETRFHIVHKSKAYINEKSVGKWLTLQFTIRKK